MTCKALADMVKCESEPDGAGVLAGPVDSAGFRLDAVDAVLGGHDQDPLETLTTLTSTSASSYSIYKQRIDAMFDETRSLISGYGYCTTTATSNTGLPPPPPPPLPTRLEGAARAEAEAERRSRKGANVVQARIEKMFAEMSTGGLRSGGPGLAGGQRFSVDYLGSVPLADKVTTLQGLQGPLKDLYFGYRRDRARRGAQSEQSVQPTPPAPWQPGFLEISGSGLRVHHGEGAQGQPGQLGQLEHFNPFPRIAVWAAVQFVCRDRERDAAKAAAMECAFLPLIPDPSQGGVDKEALFRELNGAEERVIRSMRSILRPSGDAVEDEDAAHHAPMFAVVMRGAGASRQLECHGFVCASSEDAIVMAANLYQALMASMRTAGSSVAGAAEAASGAGALGADRPNGVGVGTGSGARILAGRIARMHHENGIGRLSIAGSVCGDSANGHSTDSASAVASPSLSAESTNADRAPEDAASLAAQQQAQQARLQAKKAGRPRESPPPQPKVPPPVPKRPPRKKKSSGSSTDGDDLIVLEDAAEPPRANNKTNMSSLRGGYRPRSGVSENGTGNGGGSGRPGSRRSSLIPSADTGVGANASGPGGDILTKVAIPRSHSFLNANGPLTRYGRRPPNHARNAAGGADPASAAGPNGGGVGVNGLGRAGGGGGSPLGFNELFTEFRQQEGLDSLDDILGAIIDAEGMSFNDLKPIYKEFLLKLALTLTKDELYHRSKSIMRRQRKKQLLGGGLSGRGRHRGIAYTAVYIKKAVRRSINKLRPSKRTGLGKLLFSSHGPAKTGGKSGQHKKKSKKKMKPVVVPASSISSYPSSNFRMSRRPSISVSQALDAACNVNVNVSINNNNNNNNNNNRSSSAGNNKARLPRRRSSHRNRHHQQPPLPPLATSTSEDSDFFTMIRCDSSRGGGGRAQGTGTRSGKGGGMNRSSSGYVSCSDCSYDSESCTCLSAERCYCSLSKYRPPPDALPLQPQPPHQPPQTQPCPCACDTDSCQGSDKCYCTQRPQHGQTTILGNGLANGLASSACTRRSVRDQAHHARCGQRQQRQRQRRGSSASAVPLIPAGVDATPPPANIFEQLRQQGFAASDSSLSRAESPMTAWRKNESRVSGRAHRGGGGPGHGGGGGGGGWGAGERRKQRASSSAGSMRSSRSLEFLQGPLLGHLQANLQAGLQGHLLPQHQYPSAAWEKGGKPAGKSSGKPPKNSSKQVSASKVILDGFGSARSRCPSRMDMYRSSSRSCSYIAAPVLEPPAIPLGLLAGRQGRPRTGSVHGHPLISNRGSTRAGSRPTSRPTSRPPSRPTSRPPSRPTSRASSRADSWVCEDDDADEPIDEDVALNMDEDVLLLIEDTSSSHRRPRQPRQSRQQRKVLVVSARDPEGRVIYMGASASARIRADAGQGQGVKAGQFFPRASLSHSSSGRRQSRANLPRHGHGHAALSANKSDPYPNASSMAASEALSVKKSAEIAALFTGVQVSQTTDIVATARSTDVTDSRDSSTTAGEGEDLVYSSLDGHSRGHGLGQRPRQGMYPSHTVGNNLENSLGYLP